MLISILHPSYGRPALAVKTAKTWLERSGATQIEYILCLTYQDPLLNSYRKLFADLPEVKIVYTGHGNMVVQGNYAASICQGELIIQTSDDFTCPDNWSVQLLSALEGKEDYLVKIDDGIRAEGIDTTKLMALPIMDRAYYHRFKHTYHPDYKHFYGDEELYAVGEALGRIIHVDIVFEHLHPIVGKSTEDATNKKNNRHFNEDKSTFERRKAINFGL